MSTSSESLGKYLCATGREDVARETERQRALLSPDPAALADPHAHYDQVLELDLSELEPHVVGPHSPDRARPISQLAAEVRDESQGFVDQISAAGEWLRYRGHLGFRNPADYDEIREGDLLDLVGLGQLAETRPVECVARHRDETKTHLELNHSYTEAQLPWFRAGSALNTITR